MPLGKLAQPVRVAITGGAVSPPIFDTLELLGRARSLGRIAEALHCLRLVFTELPRATTLEHIEALLLWDVDRGDMQTESAPQG
jgi:hypothetical protein